MKTREDIIKENTIILLNAVSSHYANDPEMAHAEADVLIMQYLSMTGHQDVADAYKNAHKKVGFRHS